MAARLTIIRRSYAAAPPLHVERHISLPSSPTADDRPSFVEPPSFFLDTVG
jgi:hypothetical protein